MVNPADTISRDFDGFVDALDRFDALPQAIQLRQRSYELLGIQPGDRVVDVGCGAGLAVAELAAAGVKAIGVDIDDRMITTARRRHPGLEFHTAAADALPLPRASVAGYRADKLYHILDDPARALTEARRVLAPGGRVVLLGQDWDLIALDADDAALTRTIIHARSDTFPHPRSARRYRNLLLDSGFEDVTVEVITSVFTDWNLVALFFRRSLEAAVACGALTHAQGEGWVAEQQRRALHGRFFAAVPMFLAAGRRASGDSTG